MGISLEKDNSVIIIMQYYNGNDCVLKKMQQRLNWDMRAHDKV